MGAKMRSQCRLQKWLLISFSAVTACYLFLPEILRLSAPPADRDQYECHPGPRDPRNNSERPTSPILKIIELTDTGAVVDRCQWTGALDELGIPDERNGQKIPKIAILYIHGWKHNASTNDSDRVRFGEFIKQIDANELKSPTPRRVVGIYVGWNAAIGFPLVYDLTYWSRKIAADRISQSAIVTKLVGAIESIRRQRDVDGDRIFLIGHSFGARILYSATSQVLLYKTQMAHPGRDGTVYSRIDGPADVIFLVNPAFEASMFTAMDSVRRNRKFREYKEKFSNKQEPVLVSISTTGDDANRLAFPVGQWLGFGRSESEYTAIGHYERFGTHRLRREPESGSTKAPSSDWTAEFCESGICLRRTDFAEHNPFVVATTDPDILKDHNAIWCEDFAAWMISFFRKIDSRLAKGGGAR